MGTITKGFRASWYAHVIIYWRVWKFSRKVDIRNADETLDYILNHRVSVSRFGDGEIDVIAGRGNGMQVPNKALGERLVEVLHSNMDNHIVCLPYAWKNLCGMNSSAKAFFRWFVSDNYMLLKEHISVDKKYYNASFTRFYIDFRDKSHVGEYVRKMVGLWKGRDVYIIEGYGTNFGINNDLLQNVNSVYRILCPSSNAFDKYDAIINKSLSVVPKRDNTLILCALGMTATVLAYDLAKEGYQTIDIGHADIEYMWYKMGAKEKIPVKGKSVNEVGRNVDTKSEDSEYLKQVIAQID